ncbi:hypothetical protein ABT381_03690 [Streptomyces sp. NPDC000151]|uniref:hypothetical protein n=1 Tax=Streptomyces sp. NPDC000151 TaxID=3154244 RepID=UPI003320E722
MTQTWLGMPTPLASALISAVVALVVSILGPSLKYGFDKRFHRRKLDIEYAYEQQKELRNRIALYKGLLLETGGSMSNRLWNFFRHEGHGWLRMNGSCAASGYYIRSFAYRILCLIAVCRLIERQALFVDSVVAAGADRKFMEAMKLNIAVWIKVDLYDGLEYDGGRATDHFLRDRLADMADTLYIGGHLLSLREFRNRLAADDAEYCVIFNFLDGARRQEEGRFRFDRLVAVQLSLLATLNRFGYEYQHVLPETFTSAAEQCEHPVILVNLCALVKRYRLEHEEGFREMVAAASAASASR